MKLSGAIQVDRTHRNQQRDAPLRYQQTEGSTARSKYQTLGQELTDDAAACRAECRTDRYLTLSRSTAREQQIGDVRTGDEQNECDGAGEHEQG